MRASVGRAVILAAMLAASPALAGEPESKFENLKEHIGKIVDLTLDADGKLVLDRSDWGAAPGAGANVEAGGINVRINVGAGGSGVDKRVQELGRAVGARGFSMSIRNNQRTRSFSGGGVAGSATSGPDRFEFALRETAAPGNDLRVSESSDAGLRLTFSSFDGDLAILAQFPNGRVSAAVLSKGGGAACGAASFAELRRDHRRFVNEVLFARLRGLGVKLFPDPLGPDVIAAVCRRLGSSAKTEAAFDAFLKRLDADDFREREAATKELKKVAAQFLPHIRAALEDPPSAEVKERLEAVLTAAGDVGEVHNVIDGLDLLDDVDYLIELLGRVEQPRRPAIADRLHEMTGQKLGPDPAAWKRWKKASREE
ncbi:MAG: hypothetical protein R6V58_00700 [Planctomycetota bacterium]